MRSNKKTRIIIAIIIMIILIDQISKIIIINNVGIEIGTFSLKYNEEEKKKIDDIIISILTEIVVFIVIIKFLKEQNKNMDTKIRISLACILGAGISNCIDKIWNRNVINFISIGNLPKLNLAYIILIISWLTFIICMVKNTMKVNEEIKQIDKQKRTIGRE